MSRTEETAGCCFINRNVKYCEKCYKFLSNEEMQRDLKTSAPSTYTVDLKGSMETFKIKSNPWNKVNYPQLYRDTVDHCPYKKKCFQCTSLIQQVRSLLEEIKAIRKIETNSICIYCKRFNKFGKCLKCEMIFKNLKEDNIDDDVRQRRFRIWICKVKELLYSILDREKCTHPVLQKGKESTDELTTLLRELKLPLNVHEPYIGYFPSIDSVQHITESKEILDQVLLKLKPQEESVSKSIASTFCICKYIADRNLGDNFQKLQMDKHFQKQLVEKLQKLQLEENMQKQQLGYSSADDLFPTVVPRLEDKTKISTKKMGTKSPSKMKSPKSVRKSIEAVLKAKKKRDQTKDASVTKKLNIRNRTLPSPGRRRTRKLIDVDVSESVIECEITQTEPTDMVKGNQIVPIHSQFEPDTESIEPLFFKVAYESQSQDTLETSTTKLKNIKTKIKQDVKSANGILTYMLSNVEFIEKGWTQLPEIKVMKRVNVYKMTPVDESNNWFKKHKADGIKYHDTCEKLAEIEENGNGKLFYKNGRLAMIYFSSPVYSDGERDLSGKKLPLTVLAAFDYNGDCVVYDHYGNERIKFNQSEGLVIDKKIGAPSHWKWHTLNDSPVLQSRYIDAVIDDPCVKEQIDKYEKKQQEGDDEYRDQQIASSMEMVAIELDNFVREKEKRSHLPYKPFKIRTKMLKINKQFALKILDQTNIYLLFTEGTTSIKFNLGMHLISTYIVDTVTSDVGVVETRYERKPSNSELTDTIQNMVEKAKKFG